MRVIILSLVVLLSGCAASPEFAVRELPNHPWRGAAMQATHVVTVARGENTQMFQSRLSLKKGHVVVVLLDGLGRRGATITWTDDGVRMKRADWFPENITADQLLSDLVLVYWPEADVRSTLASGISLKQSQSGRALWSGAGMVANVKWPDGDRWNGESKLVNVILDYQMTIQSIRETP